MSSGSMIFGNCRGKMGDVVFQRSAQKEFQRVYLSRHRKNFSLKNLAVRARLAICAKAWNHFSRIGMTDYTQREFCKINFKNVYLVTREQYENDPCGLTLFDWNLYPTSTSPFSYTDENQVNFTPYETPIVSYQENGIVLQARLQLGQYLPFAQIDYNTFSYTCKEFYNQLFFKYLKYNYLRCYFVNIGRNNEIYSYVNSYSQTLFEQNTSPDYYEFRQARASMFVTYAGTPVSSPEMATRTPDIFPRPSSFPPAQPIQLVQKLNTFSGTGYDVQDLSSVLLVIEFQFVMPNIDVLAVTQTQTSAFLIKGLTPLSNSQWRTAMQTAKQYSKENEEEILLTWATSPEEKNTNVYSNDENI